MNSPGEAFQLEYYLKSDYIHARITADSIDRALWQSLLSDVLLECARHRRKKLLLERVNATEVVQNELSNMMADLLNMNDETQIAFFNRHLLFAHEIADVVA